MPPLTEFAEVRVIHCTAAAEIRHDRIARRLRTDPHRRAHNDRALTTNTFVPVQREVAELSVDTTAGYRPELPAIAEFIRPSTAVDNERDRSGI